MKITNKKEIQESIEKFPEIPGKDISLVYFNDFYDGVIDGLCTWKGKEYYFCWDDTLTMDLEGRVFALIDLTPEQLIEDKRMHKLLVTKVGYPIADKDEKSQNDYYQEYEKTPKTAVQPKQIIGWFKFQNKPF